MNTLDDLVGMEIISREVATEIIEIMKRFKMEQTEENARILIYAFQRGALYLHQLEVAEFINAKK